MRFIKPSFEIMQCPDGRQVLRFLERVARTCYKSEDKIDHGAQRRLGSSEWIREPLPGWATELEAA